ncbi:MAG: TatD family hydrolase [Chloroflexi bacterium]|nr:TatD family hydrolase [Chloroflexota bacterium]
MVDTHCHVQTSRFDQDRAHVLANAAEAGVATAVCVGYDADSWRRAQLLMAEAPAGPRLYATAGMHPHDAKDCTPALLDEIRELALAGKIVAIGECGLDFYRNLSTPEQQRDVFVEQMELAKELNLPLVIHDRDAHESVVELLRAHKAPGGVMHCFSGDWELAKQCLDLGFHLSIAGPVTYANASEGVRDTARQAPADRLVVETDCPYLTPHPFRGKRNEPAMVKLVLEEVARLRGEDAEQLAAATTANAQRLFRLEAA